MLTIFEEKFFSNVGDKLKLIAMILFVVEVILSVILAFAFGIRTDEYYSEIEYEFYPIVFFSILIGGPLAAYLSSLIMYGFGQLLNDIHQTNDITTKLNKKMNDELPEL